MSLKCSIFGHKYAQPDVERERDEQGSEVVITIRELETCVRCGERRVVSENKEVTTLETPAGGSDLAPDDRGSAGPAGAGEEHAGAGTGSPETGAVEGSVHGEPVDGATDAEIIDDAEGPDTAAGAGSESGAGADAGPGTGVDRTGDETPGGPRSEERRESAGIESPEEVGGSPEEVGGSPQHLGESPQDPDESPASSDDGVILDHDADDDPSRERRPGEWPQDSAEESEPDWVDETARSGPTLDESPEIESAGTAVTVPEGEFYCDECGFSTDVEASSLRAGDFCPECRRGTLRSRQSGD